MLLFLSRLPLEFSSVCLVGMNLPSAVSIDSLNIIDEQTSKQLSSKAFSVRIFSAETCGNERIIRFSSIAQSRSV